MLAQMLMLENKAMQVQLELQLQRQNQRGLFLQGRSHLRTGHPTISW
jgi:hypothetical protein